MHCAPVQNPSLHLRRHSDLKDFAQQEGRTRLPDKSLRSSQVQGAQNWGVAHTFQQKNANPFSPSKCPSSEIGPGVLLKRSRPKVAPGLPEHGNRKQQQFWFESPRSIRPADFCRPGWGEGKGDQILVCSFQEPFGHRLRCSTALVEIELSKMVANLEPQTLTERAGSSGRHSEHQGTHLVWLGPLIPPFMLPRSRVHVFTHSLRLGWEVCAKIHSEAIRHRFDQHPEGAKDGDWTAQALIGTS